MAPRRGSGGGGGGGDGEGGSIGSASCPGAFKSEYATTISYFVAYCLFFLVALGTLIAMIKIKKKHPHSEKLLGWLFGVSLSFFLLGYALVIIATVVTECEITNMLNNGGLAVEIFFSLAEFLLLCLVLYGVNTELRKLVGSKPSFLNIICGVVLGIMFVLTAAYISFFSYNTISLVSSDQLISSQQKLAAAYYVLFLLSVFLGSVGIIISIVQIRSKEVNSAGLVGWIIVLIVSMNIWVLFILVIVAASMNGQYWGSPFMDSGVKEAFAYIIDGGQALSFIAILFIAKSYAFAQIPFGGDPQQQMYNNLTYPQPQQPVYNQVPVPQQQQYPQQQEYTSNNANYNNGNGTQGYYNNGPSMNG
ncbi:hypothetical protein K469DRAFT_751291 [Zopfia rhizophila CBS 207.26]|uniref:Uncharacterized protein n=1 Tax=Zopfia rhizophila CBS 207.26 TaxID=1314779 RepID=A0A6A6DZS6_9PEZI|nr:hypothetical protein K469DRAFT_751291 [Zopfia rhizophila CBS 207.26]